MHSMENPISTTQATPRRRPWLGVAAFVLSLPTPICLCILFFSVFFTTASSPIIPDVVLHVLGWLGLLISLAAMILGVISLARGEAKRGLAIFGIFAAFPTIIVMALIIILDFLIRYLESVP
jgi:hypothetical protein